MANFLRKFFSWYGPARLAASASFTTAAAAAPSTLNLSGVASITRTGVGVFLVTLQDSAKEYLPIVTSQGTAAQAVNRPIVTAVSLPNRTVQITVTDGAGAAADTTGITFNVIVILRQGN